MIIKKKLTLILANLISYITLLVIQQNKYNKIYEVEVDKVEHGEILLKASLINIFGDDLDWIMGMCFIFLFLNIILYKKWVKSKRWIQEPIIILIISFTLTFSYQLNNQIKISNNLFKTEKVE